MVLLIFALLLAGQGALAATAIGSNAMALAALVAENSPRLSTNEKTVMARLIDDNLDFLLPKDPKIAVQADAVVCRSSDIDIMSCSCELAFGNKMATVKGRKAHELFAMIGLVGVPPDGAAGTIVESLRHLKCTIDLAEIRQMSGGGAECKFEAGGP
jgi:hypothetical protein